ncbi:MAG TPA: hypothetical protein VGM43_22920 [Bryobacteraceae bacterium]|jgi:hypothetical protein
MAVQYTTAQIDAKIAALNDRLAASTSSVGHDGNRVDYVSPADTRTEIARWTAMYPNATDAPVTTPKIRTVLAFGGKGFGC